MTEVEVVGKQLTQINARRQTIQAALAAVVRSAAEQGVTEVELARQAGVNRTTIRRMLGKGVRREVVAPSDW